MSPARAHRARVLAAEACASASAGGELVGSAYELMRAQLVEHLRHLKTIQSVERKIEAKRNFLPIYKDWVEAAVETGRGAQDRVLMTVLVWLIDVGDFQAALYVASYAIEHDLQMPDQYERNLATVLLDEIGGAALAGKLTLGESVPVLDRVLELTQDADTPDQARAKVHKALGYAYMGRTGASEVDVGTVPADAAKLALQHCRRALELFDQVGVKKDIERLERRLKSAGELSV
ncbi:phage terminase small subunit [Mitsuaria sp. GD03876]|uniref:phage terminase small subunit n=1 Tax=Mitsuaria sp. GD03876 TaxID=2975399 RepID=UPI003266F822